MKFETQSLQAARQAASVCADRLRLPLRSKVWKGAAGEFAGSGTGSSLDFQDHRNYVPGDDPRHINWQAYARTGQYTMKLYREEVRPVIDIFFDCSASMFVTEEKKQRSLELFYFLTESASQSGASLQIHLLNGDQHELVSWESVTSHHWAENLKTPEDPAAPPSLHNIPLRTNAIRVLLSDLLFSGDPNKILRTLSQRQGSTIILAPFTQAEANPDWQGNYEFIDAELQTRHPHRIEPAVLKKYLEAYSRHFSLWKASTQRHNTLMARVPAEPNLMEALHQDALKVGALESLH